jgi:hypothetical protein
MTKFTLVFFTPKILFSVQTKGYKHERKINVAIKSLRGSLKLLW